jgi:radical SAM protein with 4Fe4S-binding SPASM domain
LKRPDLYELIRYSVGLGLRTNVTPSATPLLTVEAIDRVQECGISRMAISLDGPDAASHDGFRGVGGTFTTGMRALRHAREIGLDTQIQTTVMRGNMNRLGAIAELAAEVRTRLWSLFFLVVTGRASLEDDLTAAEYEGVFDFLARISEVAPFEVKTTEAMHYRRFLSQRAHGSENGGHNGFRTAGVSEGRGFVFVSHTGEIYPSGFLPISAGNVRTSSLTTVYRDSGLFRALRDPLRREGKCGRCEFVKICGGSRARAYALTGNYLGEDPRCFYEPVGQETLVAC